MKTALITGITGQDGSYLAEFLLKKKYKVIGFRRRSSVFNTERIDHIIGNKNLILEYGDITDSLSIINVLNKYKPNEIYNLAAQSHVAVSFNNPEYTANVDALGTLRVLEAVRSLGLKSRIYQASTSELYGTNSHIPQNEDTDFMPASPYGVAKLYAFWITKIYRESYGLYACNGILFNHESPRRGNTFVSQKIIKHLVALDNKITNKPLELGNLYSLRDWGHAKEYVDMQWRMLQQKIPEDYVIATGKQYTVKEFVNKTINALNLRIEWTGEGINEKGFVNGKLWVKINKKYFRPNEVPTLLGDASKAEKELKWKPIVTIDKLIDEMIHAAKK